MKHQQTINSRRQRRRYRVRNNVKKVSSRPRLSVFRSRKHIYAQIIDDNAGRTLATAGTVGDKAYGGNKTAAQAVGKAIAEKAISAGVKEVAFDRREYQYHGRVAALAEAAREAGLVF